MAALDRYLTERETRMHPDFEQITDHVPVDRGPIYVAVAYSQMVAVFGEPNSKDDAGKTDVAWDVRSPAGGVHIYNTKNGPAYTGSGTVEDIVGFAMQGESEAAVTAAVAAIKGAP